MIDRCRWAAGLLAVAGSAHAALDRPGDIAFTAFNADEDGFSIVALVDIGAGSTVFFSDNEWTGGEPGEGGFTGGEASFRWVTDAHVPAGNVVRFAAIDKSARTASVGSLTLLEGASVGFSASGDTLYAYTGISHLAPLAFLAAISSEGYAGNDLAGTGLVQGSSAVAIVGGADLGEYTGPRSGLARFADYAGTVNDASRWTAHASGAFADHVPDGTPFTVTPVPEPHTWATLLAGLALIGARGRIARSARFNPRRATPGLPNGPSAR